MKKLEEQLIMLRTATWDGDLISKSYRKELVKLGFVEQAYGWNFITSEGIKYLLDNKLLKV